MVSTEAPSKISKIIARALCKSALDGEAEISAVMAIRLARKEGLSPAEFAKAIVADIDIPTGSTGDEPPAAAIVLGFGKYKGRTLKWVAQNHFNYIVWMSNEINDEYLRRSAETVRDWFASGDYTDVDDD